MSSSGTFGRHVVAEIWEASFEALDDLNLVSNACVDGATNCGATVLNVKETKFDPQGCSVTVTLSESHVAIHTFPEVGYASFDAYTCGEIADPMRILHHVISKLGGEAQYQLFYRGFREGIKMVDAGITYKIEN